MGLGEGVSRRCHTMSHAEVMPAAPSCPSSPPFFQRPEAVATNCSQVNSSGPEHCSTDRWRGTPSDIVQGGSGACSPIPPAVTVSPCCCGRSFPQLKSSGSVKLRAGNCRPKVAFKVIPMHRRSRSALYFFNPFSLYVSFLSFLSTGLSKYLASSSFHRRHILE